MPESTREEERQEQLEELWVDDHQLDIHHGPNSLGRHELMDRLCMLAEMVETYVLEHPACIFEPEWFVEAHEIVDRLYNFYQKVGTSDI